MKTLKEVYEFLKGYNIACTIDICFSFKRKGHIAIHSIVDGHFVKYNTPLEEVIEKYKDRKVLDVDINMSDTLEIDIEPNEEELKVIRL